MVGQLLKFHKSEGNCLVRIGHKESDFKLGIWVGTQRRNKEYMSPDRIERLDTLGFVWEAK